MFLNCLYFLLLFRFGLFQINENAKIRILQGEMQGKVMENLFGGKFYAFQGIPYAKPPIGDLRFKSPEPANPWTDILDATKEGPSCLQMTIFPEGGFKGTENCLFLNVYTPTIPEASNKQLKPVMVLLHGGGYIIGNGGTELFGPEFLLTEDIVYVSFNYRLNIFGFLSFEDPSIEVPGNAGLKDMVLALKWVRTNIASFSGDPNKVTIFGESAGGASVNLMVLSKSAKGLFHRAISMSGVATVPWIFTDRQYKYIAENLNYTGTNISDQRNVFEFINTKSGAELLIAQQQLYYHPSRFIGQYGQIGAVIENTESNTDAFITETPETIIKSGNYNQVPYILGFTRDEGALFLLHTKFIGPNFTDSNLLVPKFLNITRGTPENKKLGDKIKQFYYGDEIPTYDNLQHFIKMKTDIAFSHKIVQTTKLLLAKATNPIYFYTFEYISDLNYMANLLDLSFPIVCHADDNGYLFPFGFSPINIEPNSIEMRGVHRMVKFWTNFARNGNPNTLDNDTLLNVIWPVAKLENFYYLNINDNLTIEPLSKLIPERLKFWDDLDKPT